MGLPNSSLSQARRVEVYSWRKPSSIFYSHLDVDENAEGIETGVPVPRVARVAGGGGKVSRAYATLVGWPRCDGRDHRRVSTSARGSARPLGRIFRYFLCAGGQRIVSFL